MVCCGGIFHDDSSTPSPSTPLTYFLALTDLLTGRALVFKNKHYEKDSEGQRTVIWNGLNLAAELRGKQVSL